MTILDIKVYGAIVLGFLFSFIGGKLEDWALFEVLSIFFLFVITCMLMAILERLYKNE